ncbi:class I SAM-dependent methyltransferase [Flavobacterium sp. CF136]|uniref:class I SAM-dependent methyltransferase n=1 Tax=Flavobacterium sp. (strain CF136) TaxID=1144313 RepID=UPI000271B048|nr:class I SAM-dependent methyltransferase [Flavobacterium sp. CF136]EJL64641.1 methylase involved in ubiquinone/menaquinone biosynthesis [Flavobacterium sp. CF136]
MKDNFSKQAVDYSKFRPQYPQEMIEYIISFVNNKSTALDIATGNGQVAHKLSAYFKKVYATDISQKQLDNAIQAENVIYSKEPAENTSFENQKFDLIVVAQAVHWFDFEVFYKEIYRILKPDGIFAVLGYGLFFTNTDSDKILQHFYYNIIGPYWDAERRYLDENYETIPFPFEEIPTKKFENQFTWTFETLIGYLQTWSSVQHYISKNKQNPIDLIYNDLKVSWEKNDQKVTFPLLLRIGKLNPENIG